MNSFTMKMSVAQALAVHGLPHPPDAYPPWPLALLVQYWGLPHVPWYLCCVHGRGFYCPFCQFHVGSYPVRPCTAAPPLKNCNPASSQQPASQPRARCTWTTSTGTSTKTNFDGNKFRKTFKLKLEVPPRCTARHLILQF